MIPDQSASPIIASPRESWWFPRVWAGFLLLLIGATYPLWFSPGQAEFPLVPLINLGIPNVDAIALVSTIGIVGGLIGIVVAPVRFRPLWWLVASSLLVSFLTDQHRLQPWAYQSAIYAVVLASLPPRRAQAWLIPLAASIYIYSSAGKFDYQFAHTVGQEFLEVLTRPIGGLPEDWNQSHRARIALLFPVVELAAGIGLLFGATRKIAAVVVMLMHIVLLLILGPWGLGHSTGVLVWNIALLFQAYHLFWYQPSSSLAPPSLLCAGRTLCAGRLLCAGLRPRTSSTKGLPSSGETVSEGLERGDLRSDSGEVGDPRRAQHPRQTRANRKIVTLRTLPVYGFVVSVLFAPLTERSGYWDHWTSWALYSPHNSRVDVELHQSVIAELPEQLRLFVDEDTDGDHWHGFNLQRWSLTTRTVPLYPQARYQLSLAQKVAQRYQLGDAIRARQRGLSDRWRGEREERRLLGQREIQQALDQYWLIRQTR